MSTERAPPTDTVMYKILTPSQWGEFQQSGVTSGTPLDIKDGFMHFSTEAEMAITLAKYFAGVSPLIILAVSTQGRTEDELKWDWVESRTAFFPHLYVPLKIGDILYQREAVLNADGVHEVDYTSPNA